VLRSPRQAAEIILSRGALQEIGLALLNEDMSVRERRPDDIHRTHEMRVQVAAGRPLGDACPSELVFTYVDQIEFNSATESSLVRDLKNSAASMGEPMISGFDPKELANELRQVGLELVEDLDGQMMSERYRRIAANPLRPHASSHVALAHVPTG
jgi:hypothetical protein